mgnify:FL=1
MRSVGGKYYYFHAKKGYMLKNIRYMNSNEDVYYFGKDGNMVRNAFYTWSGNGESHTYYFMSNGKMCKTWLELNGKKYCFDEDNGIMYKDCTVKINGKTYTFDKNGVYLTSAQAAAKKKGKK